MQFLCFFCISYSLYLVSIHLLSFSLSSSLSMVCMLVQSFQLCCKSKDMGKKENVKSNERMNERQTRSHMHTSTVWMKMSKEDDFDVKSKCTLFFQSFKARRNEGDINKTKHIDKSIFSFHFVHLPVLCCFNRARLDAIINKK